MEESNSCPDCKTELDGTRCPECGWQNLSAVEDRMVARASVPNLAALYRQGRDQGKIKPTPNYGQL
jgi:anaerobic ribonucleoside-triphosphate reductase